MSIVPQCIECKHLTVADRPMKCAAFPDGIPQPILLAKHDHRIAYEGYHGIQFEALGPKENDSQ
jgi:hypothetical protein